ncbi:hypothetical protein BD324DRAFT_650081 [Kockovaella imperatae]|uniref:Beta-glucuronidase C-terminal domain-containing protein n=1 Tax=Kockovaella imperatae TaxID=4999 RepID=A0A1Y1UL06_9TREE|nr:hypothetical protein BD324DRAFT_650081 [Kockovaella imperatae]ORX38738.1 hypothetical protein BD324DRAFT_650081 [Kockovaella imperatae]
MLTLTQTTLALGLALTSTSAQSNPIYDKWCGKYYRYGAPTTGYEIGWKFPYPALSDSPLLDFQCTPRSSYYLENDAQYDPPMVIIDANITNDIGQAWSGTSGANLSVTISLDGQTLGTGSVSAGSMGTLIPISLDSLTAQMTPYNLTCTATLDSTTFTTSRALAYMPPPSYGKTCGSKIDRLTGATMVRNATAGELQWKKIFPVGFFDEIGQNSTVNPAFTPLERLYQAHANGMNFVHLRPQYPSVEGINEYLDVLESLGMYFTAEVLGGVGNMTYVLDMLEIFRPRSNLIGYYTGDELDGSDPANNATSVAYDFIYENDGYHPVQLTLNCQDYKFIQYGIQGADQIGVDPYPVNLNGAFSPVYSTPVTDIFGDSGCDNCEGSMYDIINRVDQTIDRARLLGMYRTKQVVGTPQAFDDYMETFWLAPPTGADVAVQMVVQLNHGVSIISPFDAPGSPEAAFTNASLIAALVTEHASFFTDFAYTRNTNVTTTLMYPQVDATDIASWNNGTATLYVAANFNNWWDPQFAKTFTVAQQGEILAVPFGNVTAVNGTAEFIMPGRSIAAVVMKN